MSEQNSTSPLTPFKQKLSTGEPISFKVKIIAGAQKSQITGQLSDGTIKIKVAAQAQKGKANAVLIEFISEEFDVAKSRVEILSGLTAPIKVIKIK
jgi:uncharacterized protein